eukprot:14744414-Ditylum_brightwellii.AAC.1
MIIVGLEVVQDPLKPFMIKPSSGDQSWIMATKEEFLPWQHRRIIFSFLLSSLHHRANINMKSSH